MDATHKSAGHGQAEHVEHEHNPPYMAVFWWLLAMTILEVSAGYLPHLTGGAISLPHLVLVPLLLGLAFAKATLVGMFYMHMRYDTKWISIIFLTTFALAIFFVISVMPRDYWGV